MPINLTDIVGIGEKLATRETPGAIVAQDTSGEAPLGTVTWVGTPPGGTVTKSYYYTLAGRMCTLTWRIKCTTPGLLVFSNSVPFPSGAPAPLQMAGTESDEWLYIGAGGILDSKSSMPNYGSACGIYREANGTLSLRINSGSVAVGARFAKGLVTYITEG